MFLRLLFILLAALNIAVGAWLLLGQPYAHVGSPTDPGVPELRLLSQIPASAASSPGSDARDVVAAEATHSYSCITLGPFDTPQDLLNARPAPPPRVARSRPRQQQPSPPPGWRVYPPAAARRPQAHRPTSRWSGW